MLGLFTISPATGIILPGQSQVVNVDCTADRAGKHDEVLTFFVYTSHPLLLSPLFSRSGPFY